MKLFYWYWNGDACYHEMIIIAANSVEQARVKYMQLDGASNDDVVMSEEPDEYDDIVALGFDG